MKKAKIFLTALTVLTVVGGAFAFKAKIGIALAQCNSANLKCDMDILLTTFKTTAVGGVKINYDILGKDCIFDEELGRYTCTTLLTTGIPE